ncbi:MAG TPA: hypothetical protein VM779_10955 [Thermoanaerobaculia bacterium]|nr:hypothetical protein [Thermoanaerobaculia bacterium]
MKEHYSEADLLETHYTQPGESMPVMMHLAQCSECAAKYDRLERKLREAAVCHPEKHEAFWAAQRATIMARIRDAGRTRRPLAGFRLAAAVLLGVVFGTALVYRNEQNRPAPTAAVQQIQLDAVPVDLWETEELREFGGVVEWESWIEGEESL